MAHKKGQGSVRNGRDLLNGAHTGNVLCGILAGIPIVRELVQHPDCGTFLSDMLREEILPYVPVDPRDPDGVQIGRAHV